MQKFYLIPRYKIAYSLLGILSSIPAMLFLYMLWRIPVINVFLFCMIALVAIRAIYWIRAENLAVSEKGIEYDTPGLILEAKWESIQKISRCWRWFMRQDCLVIDQSQVMVKQWVIYANSYPHILKNYPQNIAVPLSCFSHNWRDSELGQQIRQYAPHLFEK